MPSLKRFDLEKGILGVDEVNCLILHGKNLHKLEIYSFADDLARELFVFYVGVATNLQNLLVATDMTDDFARRLFEISSSLMAINCWNWPKYTRFTI